MPSFTLRTTAHVWRMDTYVGERPIHIKIKTVTKETKCPLLLSQAICLLAPKLLLFHVCSGANKCFGAFFFTEHWKAECV